MMIRQVDGGGLIKGSEWVNLLVGCEAIGKWVVNEIIK